MGFLVSGFSYVHRKQVQIKLGDPVGAIEAAVELMGEGDKDVVITDSEGRVHTSASFAGLLPSREFDNG
jgi:hypothetical protein